MGIPAKVAENSFIAAEKLILVQFPLPGQVRKMMKVQGTFGKI